MITANRYHDISCGHRVYGHENKCAHLHGHNYRFHFYVTPMVIGLDKVGRVIDFSVIKEKLCNWLEENWDHKFLVWEQDPLSNARFVYTVEEGQPLPTENLKTSFVVVPFNPTAENMAVWLVDHLAPTLLKGTGCFLQKLVIEETRKCSVTYEYEPR